MAFPRVDFYKNVYLEKKSLKIARTLHTRVPFSTLRAACCAYRTASILVSRQVYIDWPIFQFLKYYIIYKSFRIR